MCLMFLQAQLSTNSMHRSHACRISIKITAITLYHIHRMCVQNYNVEKYLGPKLKKMS